MREPPRVLVKIIFMTGFTGSNQTSELTIGCESFHISALGDLKFYNDKEGLFFCLKRDAWASVEVETREDETNGN